jgi:hypothetical protein
MDWKLPAEDRSQFFDDFSIMKCSKMICLLEDLSVDTKACQPLGELEPEWSSADDGNGSW